MQQNYFMTTKLFLAIEFDLLSFNTYFFQLLKSTVCVEVFLLLPHMVRPKMITHFEMRSKWIDLCRIFLLIKHLADHIPKILALIVQKLEC